MNIELSVSDDFSVQNESELKQAPNDKATATSDGSEPI